MMPVPGTAVGEGPQPPTQAVQAVQPPAQAAGQAPSAQQVREWRRTAQRAVRLALTAARGAWSRFQSASDRGHEALAALSDTLILLVQLPVLPLGALKDVEGLLEEAGRKLAARHCTQWSQLSEACTAMEEAVQDVLLHCQEVQDVARSYGEDQPQPQPQPPQLQEGQQQQVQLAAGGGSGFQAQLPVFASISAPRCSALLLEVGRMLQAEAGVRRRICGLLGPEAVRQAAAQGRAQEEGGLIAVLVAGALREVGVGPGGAATQPGAGGGGGKERLQQQERLRGMLTVHLSTWLSAPFLHEGRAQEVMEALAQDMAGF